MAERETTHLRVLIANERKDRLALVAPTVTALGHEVIAREIHVEDVWHPSSRRLGRLNGRRRARRADDQRRSSSTP
jgi:hypothetical protein